MGAAAVLATVGNQGWAHASTVVGVPSDVIVAVLRKARFGSVDVQTLVGAVELVSPSNKDRPASREALVSKCAGYIRSGVGLVVVDVVTDRPADLHRDLLQRVGSAGSFCSRMRDTLLGMERIALFLSESRKTASAAPAPGFSLSSRQISTTQQPLTETDARAAICS